MQLVYNNNNVESKIKFYWYIETKAHNGGDGDWRMEPTREQIRAGICWGVSNNRCVRKTSTTKTTSRLRKFKRSNR